VGLFITVSPLPGALVLLPATVFVAIHLYRRRQPLPLRAMQGARLGAVIAVLGFVIPTVIALITIAHDPAEYRRGAEEQLRQLVANTSDPQAKEAMQNLVGKVGVVFLTVVSIPFFLGFLLVIGSVSGALAASLPRNRSGP
jgi:hypothetical protein